MSSAVVVLTAALAHQHSDAQTQAMRGEASVTTSGGYARLVIRTDGEMESQVRMTSGILVVQFRQPVNVAVDKLGAADYIGAARRDPDGRALRFALRQKVRVSSMVAGERLFIDLLPESWTGEPPGLPREVIAELSKRASEAERIARVKVAVRQQEQAAPVRVRVAAQPTFTRYIFELPDMTGVTTERGKDKLTLTFGKPLRFDLADAKLATAKAVAAVDAGGSPEAPEVLFKLSAAADIRTFREDSNYVVDVSPIDRVHAAAPSPLAGVAAPQTVPAQREVAKAEPPTPAAEESQRPAEAPAPKPAVAEAPSPEPRAPRNDKSLVVEVRRQGESLRLFFPFANDTPAAMFQRGDTLWLVFDTPLSIDGSALSRDSSKTIRSVAVAREDGAQVMRVKLERPRLTSVEPQDGGWLVSIGEAAIGAVKGLVLTRSIVGPGRSTITVPFDAPHKAHWLNDAEGGDRVLVVTGAGPSRGLVKAQDFVELQALASAHGLAVQPIADDLKVELAADKVMLTRPEGLTLSEASAPPPPNAARAVTFDSRAWNIDRDADYTKRQYDLVRTAAEAPFNTRTAARVDLARFYLARQFYAEAKAVLDTAIADEKPTAEDPSPLVLRAVTSLMLGRPDDAQKDLANPAVGNQNDAPLWRAVTLARQGRYADARDAFRTVEGALAALPVELQRQALKDALRAAVEVGDVQAAAARLNDFKIVGLPSDIEPAISLLNGRLAERAGRNHEALAAYRFAGASDDRQTASQAKLREASLRYTLGELNKPDTITALETVTTAWRGDETEVEALQMLARFYTETDRFRDAFQSMRVALTAFPRSPLTRAIQTEAAQTFDGLFLAGKGDALPAIDALSLFYDFRDLTPIGRRGDEMIRRLAERLVSVDLLDQASELLQYQIDNRLQGAARAQVATRLAVIYLLNRKPDRSQAVLRATRTADLSNEIRVPRLLIEARALADMGRRDFALEVINGLEGRETLRLRADILWGSRQWQKAAEHIELLLADRWQGFEPLTDAERADAIRAALGYALAEDKIGAARLRDKYAAKMTGTPDAHAFDIATGGLSPNSLEFREVARQVASADTLLAFLRELRTRYPEMNGILPGPVAATAAPAVSASPKSKTDPEPTGSIRRDALRPRLTAR